jgi:hypothetical protein
MNEYTLSTNSGFATAENLNLLNADIDSQITDNTRLNTQIVGDTIVITFSSTLSNASITSLHNIFTTLDKAVKRGDKLITIYPMTHVKTTLYHVITRVPYHNYKITNIEVNGYMDLGLNYYKVQIYDPINNKIIAEKQLNNSTPQTSDLGDINNLPDSDINLEVNVKINGTKLSGKSAYIESIVIYYN